MPASSGRANILGPAMQNDPSPPSLSPAPYRHEQVYG